MKKYTKSWITSWYFLLHVKWNNEESLIKMQNGPMNTQWGWVCWQFSYRYWRWSCWCLWWGCWCFWWGCWCWRWGCWCFWWGESGANTCISAEVDELLHRHTTTKMMRISVMISWQTFHNGTTTYLLFIPVFSSTRSSSESLSTPNLPFPPWAN